jgi:hypothetical protein
LVSTTPCGSILRFFMASRRRLVASVTV